MDQIIFNALIFALRAAAEGALNKAGADTLDKLKHKLRPHVPDDALKQLERNPQSQRFKDLCSTSFVASPEDVDELTILARQLLSTIEHKPTNASRDAKIDLILGRLFELFDRHFIDRPTMAEILDVPLSRLKGDGLVDHLDNKMLDKLAATFAVHRDWLLGNSDCPTRSVCDWYKSPLTAMRRLVALTNGGRKPKIYFVKSNRMDDQSALHDDICNHYYYVAVVVEMNAETPTGRAFKSCERWKTLVWNYQKSRIDLLTLVMFCERISGEGLTMSARAPSELESQIKQLLHSKFSWRGLEVDQKVFDDYKRGLLMPLELVSLDYLMHVRTSQSEYGGWRPDNAFTWGIDDYVDLPEESTCSKVIPEEYEYIKKGYSEKLGYLLNELDWDGKRQSLSQREL